MSFLSRIIFTTLSISSTNWHMILSPAMSSISYWILSKGISNLLAFSSILETSLTLPVTNSIGEYSFFFLNSLLILLNFTFNSSTAWSYGIKKLFHSITAIYVIPLLTNSINPYLIISYNILNPIFFSFKDI